MSALRQHILADPKAVARIKGVMYSAAQGYSGPLRGLFELLRDVKDVEIKVIEAELTGTLTPFPA